MPHRLTRKAPKKLAITGPLKAQLAERIGEIVETRYRSQTEAALSIGEAPSQLCLVVGQQLRGFSVERLLVMLVEFGENIDVILRAASPKARARGKVRVVARPA